MELTVVNHLDHESLDGWIAPFLEGENVGPGAALDGALDGTVAAAMESGEFTGKADQTFWIRPLGRLPVTRVLAVGLGRRGDATAARVHRAYAVGARALRDAGARRLGGLLPPDVGLEPERLGQSIAEGVGMGAYDFLRYKSTEAASRQVDALFLQVPEPWAEAFHKGLATGRIMAEAVNFARDVANEVPSVATPAHVASIALGMESSRIRVTVLDEVALQERGMNAILAVGRGSANPPRIVALDYRGAGDGAPIYAVVGKGVCFDSGGLSLKSAAGMEDMKFDKCGACAVFGIVRAAADLGLRVNVLGVAGLVENLPGGTAYKPGDVVRAGTGKTIEVLNTDAEGRVVLADALYYAGLSRPAAMVDLATLTGACVVALGDLASGIMGTDQALIGRLVAAGEVTGERLWQLPLWPEYDEKVKSDVADVKNIGERSGQTTLAGAIAGASFLKAFVPEGMPWAHLDIAGTANDRKKRPYRGVGATGVGVRVVTEWLRTLAEEASG